MMSEENIDEKHKGQANAIMNCNMWHGIGSNPGVFNLMKTPILFLSMSRRHTPLAYILWMSDMLFVLERNEGYW